MTRFVRRLLEADAEQKEARRSERLNLRHRDSLDGRDFDNPLAELGHYDLLGITRRPLLGLHSTRYFNIRLHCFTIAEGASTNQDRMLPHAGLLLLMLLL